MFKFRLAWAALTSIALVSGSVAGQEKLSGPGREAAGPESPATNSPVSGRSGGRDGLLQLENELSSALKVFKPSTALEAPPGPTVRPRVLTPAVNKRAKELEERRKNWLILHPDDLTATPTLEELFSLPEIGPDGELKKTPSSLKRFFEGLDPQRQSKSKSKLRAEDDPSARRKRAGARDNENGADDSRELSEVRARERDLKDLLGAETSPAAAAPVRNTWLDIFGLGNNVRSPEQEKAHKDLMQEFQQLMDGPKPAASGNEVLNAVTASGAAAPVPAAAYGSLLIPGALSRPSGFGPQLGGINSPLAGSVAPDLSSKALNSWNPLYTPPSPQPARTPPPQPNFDVPRRKF